VESGAEVLSQAQVCYASHTYIDICTSSFARYEAGSLTQFFPKSLFIQNHNGAGSSCYYLNLLILPHLRRYVRRDADGTGDFRKKQCQYRRDHTCLSPAATRPVDFTRTSMGDRPSCTPDSFIYRGDSLAECGPPRRLRCGRLSSIERRSLR
jgi:hypothetical protein